MVDRFELTFVSRPAFQRRDGSKYPVATYIEVLYPRGGQVPKKFWVAAEAFVVARAHEHGLKVIQGANCPVATWPLTFVARTPPALEALGDAVRQRG